MEEQTPLQISFSGLLKGKYDKKGLEKIKKAIVQKLKSIEEIESFDFDSFGIKYSEPNLQGEFVCEYPIEKVKDIFNSFERTDTKVIDIASGGKNFKIKLKAQKYRVFKENLKCVVCGLEASKVFLEIHYPQSPTLSFYGVHNEELILLTKDHIHPKSHGGSDSFSNYQTMCSVCNSIKSNFNLNLSDIKKLKNKFEENKKESNSGVDKNLLDLRQKLAKPLNPLKTQIKEWQDVEVICDLHVFKNEDGYLEADYFSFVKNKIGCIKRRTFLKTLAFFDSKAICSLNDANDQVVIIKKENLKRRRKKR